MEKRLHQESLYLPYSFFYEEIRANLKIAAERFDLTLPDCDAYEEAIERKAAELKVNIGNIPIAIDCSATPRPLSLARFLLTHGFRVYAVFLDEISAVEKDDFYFLQKYRPMLSLRSTMHYKRRLLGRDDVKKYGTVLAIGQKAAYFTGTNHFVNLIENSGLYGYTGLLKILDMMAVAVREEKNVPAVIQTKAWGCQA